MKKVPICIELEDEVFRSFEAEAKREGVPVEGLLEQVLTGLLRDLEQERRDGTDHLIFPR
jgi:hypothetical protein